MKLLDAVTSNTVGTAKKVVGPTTLYVESAGLGGGTITIYAQRTASSRAISIGTYTGESVVNDTIIGAHYLSATLAGATSPSATTVATSGT